MNIRVKGDSYYGAVAANYETRRRKQDWWRTEQEEMRALLHTLPRGLSVLDVPFGTGRFVPYYHERGFSISGLDASNEMLAQAGRILGADAGGCDLRVGSAMELPYEDGAFDLVVSTRFLRDIITYDDARRALAEFARVCRGHAIIQLGQTADGTSGQVPPGHPMGSTLSGEAIDDLLAVNGFAVAERRLVKADPADNSEIFHVLCRKV